MAQRSGPRTWRVDEDAVEFIDLRNRDTELSWTPPVLVGTRLYLRDRRTMMAVDLS